MRSVTLALIPFALLLNSCAGEKDPRDLIVTAINDSVAAVEAGDIEKACVMLSEKFSDSRGNDGQAVMMLISFQIRQHGSVHVIHKIRNLVIEDSGIASAKVVAAVAGTPISLENPLEQVNADILRIDLKLVEEDPGIWRVTKADWRSATMEELF